MESKNKKRRNLRSSTLKKKKRIKKKLLPLIETENFEIQNKPKKKKKKSIKRITKKEKAKKKRIETMTRDAERYALIDLHKNKKGDDEFVLMNLKVNKTRKVAISFSNQVSCSCIDWRIRCKKMNISCKHILYVLSRILKLDFEVIKNLEVKNAELFFEKMNKIKKKFFSDLEAKFQIKKDKQVKEDDVCPICYTEFEIDTETSNLLQCPDCSNLVHKDCMKLWLENASRKTCVYCRSTKWTDLKV